MNLFFRRYYLYFFFLALILRMENMVVFASLNIDRAIQLAATYNFMNGHGILLSSAAVGNALSVGYTPFQGWPPGLTFCLMPVYFFLDDLIAVNRIVDCVFIFLFFIAVLRIIKRIYPENFREIFAVFCLLNSFSFSPFHYFTSTDLYALTFLLFAFVHIIDRLNGESVGIKNSLMISLFIFASSATRFAYLPLGFLLPASLLIIAKLQKNRLLMRDSYSTLAISILLTCSVYFFQASYYNGTYLGKVHYAFRPENLLKFDPFIYRAFFFTEPLEYKLTRGSIEQLLINGFAWTTSFFLLVVISHDIYKEKRNNARHYFNLIFSVVMLTFLGMLTSLSLVTPTQSFTFYTSWTYVGETRYFAPILFFVQLFVSRTLLTYEKNWLAITFRCLAIISFCLSVLYFSFKHYKILIKDEREGTTNYDERYAFTLYHKLDEMDKSLNSPLVASRNRNASVLSIIGGGIPVSNYDSLLLQDLTGIKNKTILVECDRPLTPKQQHFISTNKAILNFSIADKDWYKINLK